VEALARMGRPAIPILREAFEAEGKGLSNNLYAIVRALRTIGGPEVVPLLAQSLRQAGKMFDEMKIVLHIVGLGGDSLSTRGAPGRLMLTALAAKAAVEKRFASGRWQSGNVARVLESKTAQVWLANRATDAAPVQAAWIF